MHSASMGTGRSPFAGTVSVGTGLGAVTRTAHL
jgi:hypothetical protein